MMVERQGHLLHEWITAAQASGLKPLAGFARGLTDDYEAVLNGISLPYSSGAVEGNVNRIIMWNLICRARAVGCTQYQGTSCG
jgi:transposase